MRRFQLCTTVIVLIVLTTAATAECGGRCRVVCECCPTCAATPTNPGKPVVTCTVSQVQPAGSNAQSSPARTSTDPAKVSEGATELDRILVQWENATSKIRHLHCEFSRFRYDPTFGVEKRAEGTISLDRSNKARYDARRVAIGAEDVSKKFDRIGKPYELRSDSPECWHWTGPQLYRIDDKARTYEVVDVSANGRIPFFLSEFDVWNFFWAKPFLLGMPVAELKEQFTVTLLGDKPDDEIWLTLVPRRKEIAVQYERGVVILDRHRWLAKAIKTRETTGSETVHVFKDVTVNSPGWLGREDLSEPKLEGDRKVEVRPPAGQPSK